MSKTTKPLTIAVDYRWYELPWVDELRQKGHRVVSMDALNCLNCVTASDCDLILGPTCARFLPGMEKWIESFIRGARSIKYPKGKKND